MTDNLQVQTDTKALADIISADYIEGERLTGKARFSIRYRAGQWFTAKGHSYEKTTVWAMRCEIAQKLATLRNYSDFESFRVTKKLVDDVLFELGAIEGIFVASGQAIQDSDELSLTAFSDILPQTINWLWPNKFPLGTFTLLSGDPGAAKSYFTHYMASVVSAGGKWPDCEEPVPKGSVIIVSDEDDPSKVIRPRLDAHKAQLDKIHIVTGEFFNIRERLAAMENTLVRLGDCRLIIIDPITAYLAQTNANSNSEVRETLTPLAAMAARYDLCVIAINHLNKRQDLSYMYRGLGSQGFVALARSAWAIVADKDDEQVRILAPVKANYCVDPTGLKFRITDGGSTSLTAGAIEFEAGVWTGHLDDTGKNSTKRIDEACDWLRQRLKDSAVSSDILFDEAKEKGFSRNLLYRAKDKLGVGASREGFGKKGGWFWRLSDEG